VAVAAGLLRWPAKIGGTNKNTPVWVAAAVAAGLVAFLLISQGGWSGTRSLADAYHHYMGPKYLPELGYQGLYDCTLAADLAAGTAGDLNRRAVRDLRDLSMVRAAGQVERAGRCKASFSPSRWLAFTGDVAWFRRQMSVPAWHGLITDHGFNGAPVWALVGRLFSAAGPVSELILRLSGAVDYLVVGLMWFLVLRVFGPRRGVAAGAYWLCNYPTRFSFLNGTILRQAWLGLSVGGVCALGAERPLVAGLALGAAAQLRLFPGALLVGPCLDMGRRLLVRARPLFTTEHRRLALGVGLSLAALAPTATVAAGGVEIWPRFAAKVEGHMAAPLSNNMGLGVVASYSHAGRAARLRNPGAADPFAAWRQARARTYQERRPVHLGLIGAYLVLLALAVRGKETWRAALLGVGLIPVAAEVPCYDHAVLLGYGLLAGRWRGVGAGLNLYAAAGWLMVSIWPSYDQHFTWLSALGVLYVVGVTARAAVKE